MKIFVQGFIIKLFVLIAFITLFSAYPFVSLINRMLAIFLLCMLCFSTFFSANKKSIFLLFLCIFLVVFALYKTIWPIKNLNEIIYFPLWVLLLNNFKDKYELYKEGIKSNLNFISFITIVWTFFVIISCLFSSSFVNHAFQSFSGSPHRFATCAFFFFAVDLLLYYKKNNKLFLLLSFVPLILILLTGARTYMLIAVFAFFSSIYYHFKSIYKFMLFIVPISIIGFIFIINSSVMKARLNDMEYLTNYYNGDVLKVITSGRSEWWKIDLEKNFETPVINQFFGNGYHFVRYVNETFYGQNIWAHNDFVQLLCTNGIVGLIVYLICYFRFSNFIFKKYHITKKRKNLLLFLHLINFINAMFNMLYTYICATFSFIFLFILFLDEDFIKISMED